MALYTIGGQRKRIFLKIPLLCLNIINIIKYMEIVMIKGVNNNLLFWRTKMEFICLSKKESVFLSPYRYIGLFY